MTHAVERASKRPLRTWACARLALAVHLVSGMGLAQDGLPPDATVPAAWPAAALAAPASDPAVADAEATLRTREADLRAERLGLSAEIRLRPRLDLTWRDDPPRPVETTLEPRPDASVAWSPLRSEVLLAEARVVEAQLDVADARRDATLDALTAPVEHRAAGRELRAARAAREAAREDLRAAHATLAAARDALAAAPDDASSSADHDAAAHALRAAELAVREAELDVIDAVREEGAAAPGRARAWPASGAASLRTGLHLPAPPRPEDTRAYRARALRLAAEVARSERYRRRAYVPDLAFEVGYAGSDARLEGVVGLRAGRPRAEVSGRWQGTIQERGWARVSATLRFGQDGPATAAEPERLRAAAAVARAELARDIRREGEEAHAEARSRRARWRLAEDALALARDQGDARGVARAERAAVRAWLRFVRAATSLLEVAEAPVRLP